MSAAGASERIGRQWAVSRSASQTASQLGLRHCAGHQLPAPSWPPGARDTCRRAVRPAVCSLRLSAGFPGVAHAGLRLIARSGLKLIARSGLKMEATYVGQIVAP